MDVSLDDYINSSNLRVQVGNPGFNKHKNAPFQGRKFSTMGGSSVTVSGVPKVAGLQANKTNQVRDARERLNQTKPKDARDMLRQKAQATDAREKLMNIRARKIGPAVPGPVDARAKIQAKKQQKVGGVQIPVTGSAAGLSLTRTVNNKPTQINSGPGGAIQITRTLSTVMPPGYEDLQGPSTNLQITRHVGGPPAGTVNHPPPQQAPSITRTIPGAFPAQSGPRAPPRPHFQVTRPRGPQPGPPPHQPVHVQYGGPPPQYNSPPPQSQPQYGSAPAHYPAPPPVQTQDYPPAPPPQYARAEPPPGPYSAPPPPVHQHPQVSPVGGPPPHQYASQTATGPPYPVEDRQQISRRVGQQVGHAVAAQHQSKPAMPVIQVQNEHYQQQPQYPLYPAYPEPQYSSQPQYSDNPTPQYTYSQPPPTSYHTEQQSLTLQRTVPNDSVFKKTITNRVEEMDSASAPLKRKIAGGPLKLSNTNTIPVIESPYQEQQNKTGLGRQSWEEPPVKRGREDLQTAKEEIISPIQGFRITVSNLHLNVSQDDIIELFGALGPMKQVKLTKPGTADVYYIKKEDAIQATQTYHNRELDGQPMQVKMVTPANVKVKQPPETLPSSAKALAGEPLKLYKKPPGMSKLSSKDSVDVSVLHKALFKTGSTAPSKPVTFTVKI